jgi:hypothetical protein
VKSAHTQNYRFIPAQMNSGTMRGEQIETHEAEDDDEIGYHTPAWPMASLQFVYVFLVLETQR